MWIAGVDGCRSGWIAVLAHIAGDAAGAMPPRVRIVPRLVDLIDGPEAPAVIAVDMPIGLPEAVTGPGRGPEQAVRPLIGARRASVFPIPGRAAVYAADYRACCDLALTLSQPPRKVSKQGFMIFPKIREIDELLRARPLLVPRVYEAHPEVAFWAMNGEVPLAEPKKRRGRAHPPGLALRRRLLVAAGLAPDLVEAPPPKGAAADDYLDALATLVVARHIRDGRGRCFPDPPARDAHGLPVAIWSLRGRDSDGPAPAPGARLTTAVPS